MRHLDDLLGSLTEMGLTSAQMTAIVVIGSLACIFWLYVYVKSIYVSYKQKATCIPTFAVCLNVTWELLASTIFEDLTPIPLWLILERLWLVFDVVILAQLFLYGRGQARVPQIKDYFSLVVCAGLVVGVLGHYTFELFCGSEPIMLPDALVINLVMSLLFVQMYFQRTDMKGLSLSVAWCKMLGTQSNTICMIWFVPAFYPNSGTWPFMWFLAITIGIVDCIYIYLVTTGQKALAAAPA